MAESGVKDSSGKPVKSILKKGKPKAVKPSFGAGDDDQGGGIQWDEMNILMTEHPPDKDYGHMKIEEPKTPYHEMIDDEEEPTTPVSADDLASRVQEAAAEDPSDRSKWDRDSSGGSDVEESEAQRQHKEEFRQWRKKHYNEFHAVQRARELIAKDLTEAEADGTSSAGPSIQVTSYDQDSSMHSVEDENEDMQQDSSS